MKFCIKANNNSEVKKEIWVELIGGKTRFYFLYFITDKINEKANYNH